MRGIAILLLAILASCATKQEADLLMYNGTIYTVDEDFSKQESMVVHEGKIVETGTYSKLSKKYNAKAELDLAGQFVYPGFYDGHCHFLGYGLSLQKADLRGTQSFEEVIERLVAHDKKHNNTWVVGRSWDQNDWPVKEFPTNELLDKAFPDKPVYITRVDGHAAIVNSAAIKKANLTTKTKVQGGDLLTKNGKLTGVLIDNAMGLVGKVIPSPSEEEKRNALLNAQENCFAVGLTSVGDAGLSAQEIDIIKNMHSDGSLKTRIYAMLNPSKENFEQYVKNGVYQDEKLTISSIKLYADGALGSRGALMLEPFSDAPGNYGLLMNAPEYYKKICDLAYENGYQVNTHCIGDSANRFILNTYAASLEGENDRRWRIEHSQIINKNDFEMFDKYDIIPSIQTTHATSDMYWAEDRVGAERINGAYSYQTLLAQNGWVVNGSDFPVEQINPLLGFYAGVARQDVKQWPENGFRKDEGLTREQALRGMTIWAAKGGFEEKIKGSLEAGKVADFVVLKEDLMEVDIYKVPEIKVQATYVDGKAVFRNY